MRNAAVAFRSAPAGLDELYLFGSALRSEQPGDIDLLLVYDEAQAAPKEAWRLAAYVRQVLGPLAIPPVEIVLLTRREAASSRFAQAEGAHRVWPE
jgi:predicted nucleotidyltransferase